MEATDFSKTRPKLFAVTLSSNMKTNKSELKSEKKEKGRKRKK
jgi:hypothetical protein